MDIKNWLGSLFSSPTGRTIGQEDGVVSKGTANGTELPMAYVDGNTFKTWTSSNVNSPYKQNGTIRRSIDIMAYNLAQLPFNVFQNGIKVPSDIQDPNNVLIGSLLKSPNADTSGFKFKLIHWSYFLMYDSVYWLINRNPFGIIKELYILNPRMVSEHVDSNNVIDYYTYGHKLKLQPHEIVKFSGFNPSGVSGSGGHSILDTLKTEYQTDKAAANYGQKFFENGTKVSGVITGNDTTTLEEMQKVLGQWMTAHQGESNAYKVGALLGGMTYDERGMSMRDAEFIEGRKDIKERIIEVFGIPKSVYGLVDKIDRATAEAALRQFWQFTLKPLALLHQEDMNTLLLKKNYPGYTVKYDFAVVEELKKDVNETAEAAKKYFDLGYTRNEINERFKLEMEDDDTGDIRYLPTSVISVDNTLEMDNIDEPTKTITTIEEKTIETKSTNPFRNRFLQDQRSQEKIFHSKIKRYLFEYRQEAIKIVSGNKATVELATIINALNVLKNKQDNKLFKITVPLYTEASKVAADGAYDLLNIDKVSKGNTTLANTSANKIKGINTTITKKLNDEITTGVANGETIDQLSKRIRGVYNFTTSRSKIIARTESANLMSASTFITYKQEGIKMKRWLDAGDDGVRPEHKDNSAQGAIPIDDVFSSGELYPSGVNCRCCLSAAIGI